MPEGTPPAGSDAAAGSAGRNRSGGRNRFAGRNRFGGPAGWALVTGGSRGIGAEVAVALAGRGYDVVVTYRTRAEAAATVVAEITTAGRRGDAVALDASDLPGCASVGADLLARYGAPRAVVHCAGQVLRRGLAETEPAAMVELFHVNVFAAYALNRVLAARMREAGGGSITHVGSVIGAAGMRDRTAYAASKSALLGLTTTLAAELAPAVRVNCVLPGIYETEMNSALLADPEQLAAVTGRIPLRRLGAARECAAAIAFLACDDAAYVTGVCLPVDGGMLGRLPIPTADPPNPGDP